MSAILMVHAKLTSQFLHLHYCEERQKCIILPVCSTSYFSTYLNSKKNPYISTIIPTTGQPSNTISMPPAKNPVALALCFWKKNLNVLSKPMTNARPLMKRI